MPRVTTGPFGLHNHAAHTGGPAETSRRQPSFRERQGCSAAFGPALACWGQPLKDPWRILTRLAPPFPNLLRIDSPGHVEWVTETDLWISQLPLQARSVAPGQRPNRTTSAMSLATLLEQEADGRMPCACRKHAWQRQLPAQMLLWTWQLHRRLPSPLPRLCAAQKLWPWRRARTHLSWEGQRHRWQGWPNSHSPRPHKNKSSGLQAMQAAASSSWKDVRGKKNAEKCWNHWAPWT